MNDNEQNFWLELGFLTPKTEEFNLILSFSNKTKNLSMIYWQKLIPTKLDDHQLIFDGQTLKIEID